MTQKTFQDDVPVDAVICPRQPREHFDEKAQAGLETTVRDGGVRVPILLRRSGGKLYLWDGARRLLAAKAVGLTTIPAIIEDTEATAADITLGQMIVNSQREDLNPVEKAKAIESVMKSAGASATEIAPKLGISDATVSAVGLVASAFRSGKATGTSDVNDFSIVLVIG